MADQAPQPQSLAQRLDRLFESRQRLDGKQLSNQDVADAVARRGGPAISKTYLWQLRRGERTNPTLEHLEALAGYFGVPVIYFLDDEAAARVSAQLDLMAALVEQGVQGIALRAAGVSTEGLQAIETMLEHLRRAEGLPPIDDTTAP